MRCRGGEDERGSEALDIETRKTEAGYHDAFESGTTLVG